MSSSRICLEGLVVAAPLLARVLENCFIHKLRRHHTLQKTFVSELVPSPVPRDSHSQQRNPRLVFGSNWRPGTSSHAVRAADRRGATEGVAAVIVIIIITNPNPLHLLLCPSLNLFLQTFYLEKLLAHPIKDFSSHLT